MVQLHRRFSGEQVAFLLRAYAEGLMSRVEVQEALHLGRSRFFALWRKYRHNPEAFSVTYQRTSPDRVTPATQMAIEQELLREQALVENPELPISGYNYSALRDRLAKQGISVSVNTIIDRAKKLGCHRPRRKKRAHDREVLTASVGALIQHDGSSHRWSPFSSQKWALITSIDDFSRMILFADFFPAETSWAHIQATQSLIEAYGVPLRYYVDSLRVFRFVQGRDSVWRKHILQTDDVDTQWGKMIPKDIGTMCASWASRSSLPSRPRPRARSKDLTAGCRIASSVPAPWRGSAPWSRSGKSCEKKSIATTITKSIPPPGRSRASASPRPWAPTTASSVHSRSPSLIPPPKMSFASVSDEWLMPIGASPCMATNSRCLRRRYVMSSIFT